MISFFLFFLYFFFFFFFLYILTVCHSVFLSLSFSLPVSPSTSLPLRFVFTRCVYYQFVCRLLAVRFLWSLPAPAPPPHPPLVAFDIFVFLSSPPVSLRFISSFPFSFLASCCCLGSLSLSLSLSFSFSCFFSLLGNAALQCCLSLLVHLRLWYSLCMLRLRFLCAGVGGVSGVVHFL